MVFFRSIKVWLVIFLIIMGLVAILFWLYLNIQASMHVTAKNSKIKLPESLPVKIDVGNFLETQSIGRLDTQIDLDRKVDIDLKGKYLANLKFVVEVPVAVDVDYQTNIVIDQTMPLSTTSDLVFPQRLMPKLPLNLDIPVKLEVPFHLKRQYTVPIQIFFDGPVYLDLDEKVQLAVKHQFNPVLNVNDPMTMERISSFNATMTNTVQNTKANLELKMDLPLKNIHP